MSPSMLAVSNLTGRQDQGGHVILKLDCDRCNFMCAERISGEGKLDIFLGERGGISDNTKDLANMTESDWGEVEVMLKAISPKPFVRQS
jgi:hypothetical protein